MKYEEWLSYHFFYGACETAFLSVPVVKVPRCKTGLLREISHAGLGNVSYRASSVTNGTVVLVGPPRYRQVRAGRLTGLALV